MKLITEVIEQVQLLVEKDANGNKSHYISGIFMQAEEKNRNGRIYPVATLRKEVARYNEAYVQKNRAFGELGHPEGPTINLERVSHMITSLHEDGNNFIGKAKIMDTPYGKIVKNLIDEGASLGVSSRGMGSLKASTSDGAQIVQDDYHLATAADIVADPSAPNAFVEGIMEGKEWIFEGNCWRAVEYADQLRTDLKKATVKDIDENKLRFFGEFMLKLGQK